MEVDPLVAAIPAEASTPIIAEEEASMAAMEAEASTVAARRMAAAITKRSIDQRQTC